MNHGPLMLDVLGTELTPDDQRRLCHPAVGGVILFKRNYENPAQLKQLCAEIKAIKTPELIICVDQEGGRVQRFIPGFSRLPAMAALGQQFDRDPALALQMSSAIGWLMAAELIECGVDLSLAPVLDLASDQSAVIGDRAFHSDPNKVIQLARAWMQGMQLAGMACTGKHFPGHGSVIGDSHYELPVDQRPFSDIESRDLQTFAACLDAPLQTMMMAHVLYPQCDDKAAGYSSFWIEDVLKTRLGFSGLVLSDDLSMQGATHAGTPAQRLLQALQAGCDIGLLCNDPEAADDCLEEIDLNRMSRPDWQKLQGLKPWQGELKKHPNWIEAQSFLTTLAAETEPFITPST